MSARMMMWISTAPGASASALFDAVIRRPLLERAPTHLVLNADESGYAALVALIKAEFPTLKILRYANIQRVPESTRIASTVFAALYADRFRLALIKRSNGAPKILGASPKRNIWTDITRPALRTLVAQHIAAQVAAHGTHGVVIDSFHGELDPSTPYAGTLDLGPLCSTLDTILYTTTGLAAGSSATLTLVADGAGAGSLTVAGTTNFTFHFQSGVTTVANFEAAITASAGTASAGLGIVLADPTPAGVLGAGDVMAAQTLQGGTAMAAAWLAAAADVLQELRDELDIIDPTLELWFNGVWNHHYSGQAAAQASLLSIADGCTAEFYGFNPTAEPAADPYARFVREINTEIQAHPTKPVMVRGTQADSYFDYAADLRNARYTYAGFLMGGVDNANAYFQYAANFQLTRLARARANTTAVHSYYDLELGSAVGTAVADGSDGLSRTFANGIVYLAPEGSGLHLWELPQDCWTTTGQLLLFGTTIAVNEGDAQFYLFAPPEVLVEPKGRTAPAIDVVSPGSLRMTGPVPARYSAAKITPLAMTFKTADLSGIRVYASYNNYPGKIFDVFDGVGFLPGFTAYSVAGLIGSDHTLSVRRDEGWPPQSRVTLSIRDTTAEWLIDQSTREFRPTILRIMLRSTDATSAVRIRFETDDPAKVCPFGVLNFLPVGGTYVPTSADIPYGYTASIVAVQKTSAQVYALDGVWHSYDLALPTDCAPYTFFRGCSIRVVGDVELGLVEPSFPVSVIPAIDPDAPIAAFSFVVTRCDVVFADTSFDTIGIVSWAWTFGDGSTSSTQHPSHTYATVGDWTATLTVQDGSGNASTYSRTVSTYIASDGPIPWWIPSTADDFSRLALTAPQHSYPANIASGNLLDVIGTLHLTANLITGYQQPIDVTGWMRTGVQFSQIVNQRFSIASGVGPNPATTKSLLVMLVKLSTPPVPGGLASVGVNNNARHMNSDRVRHVMSATPSGTITDDGAVDHTNGVVLIGIYNDPTGNVGNVQTNLELDDGVTNLSIVALPYKDPADSIKGIGGIVPTQAFQGVLIHAWWWDLGTIPTFFEIATKMRALEIVVDEE